jgi:hypothetical protein
MPARTTRPYSLLKSAQAQPALRVVAACCCARSSCTRILQASIAAVYLPAACAVAACCSGALPHLAGPVLGIIQQRHAAAAAVANYHQVLACTLRAALQARNNSIK